MKRHIIPAALFLTVVFALAASASFVYAAQTVNFTNGIINSSGNVGIGTTSPGAGFRLDVNGTANATQYCISGANCISAWPSGAGATMNASNVSAGQFGQSTGGGTYVFPLGIQMNAYANTGYLAFNNAGTYWGIVGNYGTNDWRIGWGSPTGLTGWNLKWDASGNVLVNGTVYIGSTNTALAQSSGSSLQVTTPSGYVQIGAQNTSWAHFQTDRPGFYFNKNVDVDGNLVDYGGNYQLNHSGNSYFNGGNVGVGTSGPQAPLDARFSHAANGWASNAIAFGSDTYYMGRLGENSNTNSVWLGNTYQSSAAISFRLASASYPNVTDDHTIAMSIISGGNVGIGTTSPGYKLDVNGTVNAGQYCISGANCITAWPSGGGVPNQSGWNPEGGWTRIGMSLSSGGGDMVWYQNNGQLSLVADGGFIAYEGREIQSGSYYFNGSTFSFPGGTFNGDVQFGGNTLYTSNWFRSNGASGWYNQTYGGGLWMEDGTWIRTYGGKSFLSEGYIYAGNRIYNYGWPVYDQGMSTYVMNTDYVYPQGNGGDTQYIGVGNTVVIPGKLAVGTIDPAYTINGEHYATYVSGMTGQKEETAGNAVLEKLPDGKWGKVIDFSADQGSDAWLFAKATDLKDHMDDLIVLLTPNFEGRTWYETNGSQLTIFGSQAGKVSYRLTAPRFDSAKWTNLSNDTSTKGFILND